MAKNNIPRHIGFIPDGNRRWAVDHGLPKEAGYGPGINPGLQLFERCKERKYVLYASGGKRRDSAGIGGTDLPHYKSCGNPPYRANQTPRYNESSNRKYDRPEVNP